MIKFLNSNPGFSIGNLNIAWYGLIMACSIALAVLLCYFCFCKKRGIKNNDIITLALFVLPLAIIGARFFYVVFNPMGISYSFVDSLKIWEGGMSIWGGVIGGFLGVVIYSLINKKDIFSICDVIAPALILAQSTGRWGNFINKEAYGWEIFNPKYFGLPFSVEINGHYYLATFLFEAILNTIGFVVLIILLYKTKKRGLVMSCYLMWYGVVRSVIEIFRTDPMLIGSVKFSQITSIFSAIIGLIIFIYIFVRDYKIKKQGLNTYLYSENDNKRPNTTRKLNCKKNNDNKNNKNNNNNNDNNDDNNDKNSNL